MKRLNQLARDEASMTTLVELTSAFEGIASMRISQIKNQVLQSTKFFNELWGIYSQIHVKGDFSFGRDWKVPPINKELFIVITAEGGFSGDIDQKLVRLVLQNYVAGKNDVIVVGHHGAVQLAQHGVAAKNILRCRSRTRTSMLCQLSERYKSTVLQGSSTRSTSR